MSAARTPVGSACPGHANGQGPFPPAADGGAGALQRQLAALRYSLAAVESARDRYADLFEHSPAATLVLDESGRIVESNRAAAALLGVEASDLLEAPFARFVAVEDGERLTEYLAGFSLRERGPDFEIALVRRDGTRVDARIDGRRLGRSHRVLLLAITDVSARKRTEAALREQEEFFRLIAENLGDFIAVLDLDGRRIYNSPSYDRLFGDGRDLRGSDSFAEVHADDRARIREAFRETVRTGIGRQSEYRFVLPDGSVRSMESVGGVITDRSGQVARVVVVARDVTERKEAETQLRISASAFETHVGVMVTDASAVIEKVNRAFTALTGYGADEAIGQTPRLLKSGRHDAQFYAAMWASLLGSGSWQGEIWNRRKDGSLYPQWLTITAVRDPGQTAVTHFVATMTDISERKAAEDEIRHLALYDDLTQLPNRRLLIDRLNWALVACSRNRRQGALLMIDLDHFKALNDRHGHDHGDLLLQQVAKRLTGCIREVDTAARLGGDEFVVMLTDLSDDPAGARRQAAAVGDKIIGTLNGTYDLFGKSYRSTPSIGITLFAGQRGNVDELLKEADLAMYRSKAAGRNTMRFFDAAGQE